MLKSSNPVFNNSGFKNPYAAGGAVAGEPRIAAPAGERSTTMTVAGTAWKTAYLLGITVAVAFGSWGFFLNDPSLILPTFIGSLVVGLLGGFIVIKFPRIAAFTTPLFAMGEGAFVAAISVYATQLWLSGDQKLAGVGQGAIPLAAAGTFGVGFAALAMYASGLIRLGSGAKKVIMVATAAVMGYFLFAFAANLVLGMVGAGFNMPRPDWSFGPIGIGVSVVLVVLASLNLVMDFQFVDEGVQAGLPKHYEWVGALGILTTLVWLYIELLRLILKIQSAMRN